jgi:hypothetical protein
MRNKITTATFQISPVATGLLKDDRKTKARPKPGLLE